MSQQEEANLWVSYNRENENQITNQGKLPESKFRNKRVIVANLQVQECLYNFIEREVLPGTPIQSDLFWKNFSYIIETLAPENRKLLQDRTIMQDKIDAWHREHRGDKYRFAEYKEFLKSINYLVEEPADFQITTPNVDPEVATIAAPQLVVPLLNARFAINAVNGRWGSLYDAVYGSDIISEEGGAIKKGPYNTIRGNKVIEYVRNFLDQSIPLAIGSHRDAVNYKLTDKGLEVTLSRGDVTPLRESELLVGYKGDRSDPTDILFKQNNLHIEINFDRNSPVGKTDKAGIKDVTMEAAASVILDGEDSVASVDAQDKVQGYSNWLNLIRGTLECKMKKGGKEFFRRMNPDREYTSVRDGQKMTLKGRALMFTRNVGHQMTNPAILDKYGNEVPEGIMDCMITSTCSLHDVLRNNGNMNNSSQGSIYLVKPKMHGPIEVEFANRLFSMVENALQLPPNTIKIGVMDEERRTSVNLKACIHATRGRIAFINTGFLDRTGDEMHTSMEAGPMIRKADMKSTKWIQAYEGNNVDVGLACGFSGIGQIGKGMWPAPDLMANMVKQKIGHLNAGANCAWVPSPTAAALHAMHYHFVNVFDVQKRLITRTPASLDDLLTIPVAWQYNWTQAEIANEVENNCQGILGYVVRWINQGVGCSKVPDINNIGLMEDRATLRISSQHIANWLYHGICTEELVRATLKKMAVIVDKQNASDPEYEAMAPNFEQSVAFRAASELVFLGREQLVGCTEPLLHEYRLIKKQLNEAQYNREICSCEDGTPLCPKRNKLTYADSTSGNVAICSHCNNKINQISSFFYWSCNQCCNYNVCNQCIQPILNNQFPTA